MLTDEQRAENQRRSLIAEQNAKKVLKAGDRLRVTKCPGGKRWITFAEWDGHWIVSKSGINDYSPLCVDRLNGEVVDFTISPNGGQSSPETTGIVDRSVSQGSVTKGGYGKR